MNKKRLRDTENDDCPNPKVPATSTAVSDALDLLRSSFPVPLQLSEHPKLSALLKLSPKIVRVKNIEILFDSGFMNSLALEQESQICVFHLTYGLKEPDDFVPFDSSIWLLLAPPASIPTATPCPVSGCDVQPFPSLAHCLFHHHTKLAIENLLLHFLPLVESFPAIRAASQFPDFLDLPKPRTFLDGLVLRTKQYLEKSGKALSNHPLPSLTEYRRNPNPTIALFHQEPCRVCPKLRCLALDDHNHEKEVFAATFFHQFCAEHQAELRRPLLDHSAMNCEHRERGNCDCLVEMQQHYFCCHPCFVRALYETRAGEPFPDCVGPPDIQAIIFSYMKPKIQCFCLLSW